MLPTTGSTITQAIWSLDFGEKPARRSQIVERQSERVSANVFGDARRCRHA